VRATEIFKHQSGGVVDVELGVPQQEQGVHFSLAAEVNRDADKQIGTALAIATPTVLNNQAQTLIIELIRTDGTIQATKKLVMQPGQQIARYLHENELFPGLDHFTGSVSISSPFGVSVLALRQDLNAFGGIGTDGGPIEGPFLVNSSIYLNEQEPNDDETTAPIISGSKIINGTISYQGDVDIYKFQGRAGDVVSIVLDAQTQGSYMDSEIGIFKIVNNQVVWVAYNDQNGMSPGGLSLDDSFVLAEIPSDGTYYIYVGDYWSNSGSQYFYTMHVKIP
jgi:hypothetical protein